MEAKNDLKEMEANLCLNGEVKHYLSCDLLMYKNLIEDLEMARKLAKEVEGLSFKYSQNDLHSVSQSKDFSDLALPPLLSRFVWLMKNKLKNNLENYFKVELNDNLTMSASKYNKGDYLLCHDDKYDDRCIAYIFYLTEDWQEDFGGKLRFFGIDPETSQPLADEYREEIVPLFNSFIVFRVSETSFHEVEQIYTSKPRIAISGWFHSCNHELANQSLNSTIPKNSPELFSFDSYYHEGPSGIQVLTPGIKQQIQDLKGYLKGDSIAAFDCLLDEKFYKSCVKEFEQTDTEWFMFGPPSYRKYEVLHIKQHNEGQVLVGDPNKPNIQILINFFLSTTWMKMLEIMSGLKFAVIDSGVPPVCFVEVQRWSEGSYRLVVNDEGLKDTPHIELAVFFEVNKSLVGDYSENDLGRLHVPGNVIQVINDNTPKKTLTLIKIHRIITDLNMLEHRRRHMQLLKKWKRHSDKKALMKTPKLKQPKPTKALMLKINKIVERKMDVIEKYRTNHMNQKPVFSTKYHLPKSNTGLINLLLKDSFKYVSYISHKEKDVSNVAFYALNITYFMAS